jgi:hypothetical protein
VRSPVKDRRRNGICFALGGVVCTADYARRRAGGFTMMIDPGRLSRGLAPRTPAAAGALSLQDAAVARPQGDGRSHGSRSAQQRLFARNGRRMPRARVVAAVFWRRRFDATHRGVHPACGRLRSARNRMKH